MDFVHNHMIPVNLLAILLFHRIIICFFGARNNLLVQFIMRGVVILLETEGLLLKFQLERFKILFSYTTTVRFNLKFAEECPLSLH
jgi:hypothetical protein